MTAAIWLSVAVSVGLGVLLVRLLWPGTADRSALVIAALGAGLGSGVSGILLFGWMLGFGPSRAFPLAEVGLLVAIGALMLPRLRNAEMMPSRRAPASGPIPRVLAVVFGVALGAAVLAFTSTLLQHPHGEWDAWMNWNMRARMFFRGGDHWRAGFSGAIPWSHPDYPVLLPSLVTRSWLYAGRETQLGPWLVAATFTFGTVALLATALSAIRTTSLGLLAALVLISTPFFLLHGTTLYADVPLGFFFLATVVFLALDARDVAGDHRFLTLAGIAAGLSMCTKNEGLLFTLGLVAGLVLAHRRDGWAALRRRGRPFLAGLLPFALLTVAFKVAFAPPNDLISTLGVEHTLDRLTTVNRYLLTLRAYVTHIAGFGGNGVGSGVWVLAACLLGFGVHRAELARGWPRAVAIALALVMAGHFVVFVGMAHELVRLHASSLDRLLLQLWPAALFLCFALFRAPEEAEMRRAARMPPDERPARTPVPL